MEELNVEFRASMALLACAVAFIGTHAAISMGEQFRLALSVPTTTNKKYSMLALVALSLGGVGFSGTQYVVFQSFRLRTSTNNIVAIGYDPYMVLGSALVASFVTFLGLCLASTDECFNKSQKDIMEIFIKRTSRIYSIGEIKRLGKWHILFLVCTSSLHRVLTGGFLVGGGLCLARYMAIISVKFPGNVIYHDGMVSLAIILSIVGITILFWVFFRVLSVFPSMDILRTICSLLGLAVIACVQYIRLIYVKFKYDSDAILPESTVRSSIVIVSVLTSAVLLCFLVLAYVLSDLRAWLQRTSIQLRQADRALIAMLNKGTNRTPPTSKIIESQLGSPVDKHHHRRQPQPQPQQQRFINAPPEVVNYTRKYLNPDKMIPAGRISHQNSRSLDGGGNVFAQSPDIYYDTDIGASMTHMTGIGADIPLGTNNTSSIIEKKNENNEDENEYEQDKEEEKIYAQYSLQQQQQQQEYQEQPQQQPQQQQYNTSSIDTIESNIALEMSSAMEEGRQPYIQQLPNIGTMSRNSSNNSMGNSTRSNSDITQLNKMISNNTGSNKMHSPYPEQESTEEGILGIITSTSNRIHPTTTTMGTLLPTLLDKFEDEDYEDAMNHLNDNSISEINYK